METPLPAIEVGFSLQEVALATGGTVRGDPATAVRGVGTDSRAMGRGALFVALRGPHHDGHEHVASALAAGAGAVLVERGRTTTGPAVEVDDSLQALGDLARFHRRSLGASGALTVVAITGSAGKTTTKELTAAALGASVGRVHATRGNQNNLVGVPLTVLALQPEHRAAVIECGTSAPGEIARLAAIVEPEVGVLLNAGIGHTQGLGTIEGVAHEKGALLEAARLAVVGNADDAPSRGQLERSRAAHYLFGEGAEAQVRLASRTVRADGRTRITLELSSPHAGVDRLEADLQLLGRATAVDAAAALCATLAAGARGDALRAAARALGEVVAVPGRLRLLRVRGLTLLDDTYNANPRSMQASLEAAAELAQGLRTRLVAVLGDMLELGDLTSAEHARVGGRVRDAGTAVLVAVGPAMQRAAEVAEAAGIRVLRAAGATEAEGILRAEAHPGDVVLVKGSRGMAMERVIAAMQDREAGA